MIQAKRFFAVLISLDIMLGLGIVGAFTLAGKVGAGKSSSIATLKADVETNAQVINGYEKLKQVVNSNKEVEAIAAKVLPQDKEQSVALAEIDKFSKDAKVPIKQISFSTGTAKSGPTLTSPSSLKGVLVVNVNLKCGPAKYNNLLNFLKSIEQNQRRMQVTSVAMNPSTKTPGLIDSTDLQIDIYLKPR